MTESGYGRVPLAGGDNGRPAEGFKLLGEHRDDCFAKHDEDGLVFIVHGGTDYNRRKDGRRGGSTGWHRFRCNDPGCRAVALVRWDVLARFVNDGIAASAPRTGAERRS